MCRWFQNVYHVGRCYRSWNVSIRTCDAFQNAQAVPEGVILLWMCGLFRNVWYILEMFGPFGLCRTLQSTWCSLECTEHSRTCGTIWNGKTLFQNVLHFLIFKLMRYILEEYMLWMPFGTWCFVECTDHSRKIVTNWNVWNIILKSYILLYDVQHKI